MTFEYVDWNVEHYSMLISNGMTEQEFILEGLKERKYGNYRQEDRVSLLKEAFRLLQNL